MVLVTCAVAKEIAELRRREHVEVLVTGVGPVEAGTAVSRALALNRYSLVINAGIGGAFRGRARVGNAVAVTRETYVDIGREDAAPFRMPGGVTLVERIAVDTALLRPFRDGTVPAVTGDGITSAIVTVSEVRATRLAAVGAIVESMEGFAVLRAAALARIPAMEIRGISNYVGPPDRSEWDFGSGQRAVCRALDAYLDTLDPASL